MNQLVNEGDASENVNGDALENVEGDNEFVSLECVLDAATEVGTKGQEDVKAHKNLMNTIVDHNRDREPDEDGNFLNGYPIHSYMLQKSNWNDMPDGPLVHHARSVSAQIQASFIKGALMAIECEHTSVILSTWRTCIGSGPKMKKILTTGQYKAYNDTRPVWHGKMSTLIKSLATHEDDERKLDLQRLQEQGGKLSEEDELFLNPPLPNLATALVKSFVSWEAELQKDPDDLKYDIPQSIDVTDLVKEFRSFCDYIAERDTEASELLVKKRLKQNVNLDKTVVTTEVTDTPTS